MLHASDRASQLFVQDENGRVRPVFLRESSQTLTHALLQYPLYVDLCEALPHDIAGIRGLRGKATDYEDIISHPQAIRTLPSLYTNRPWVNFARWSWHRAMSEQPQEQTANMLVKRSRHDLRGQPRLRSHLRGTIWRAEEVSARMVQVYYLFITVEGVLAVYGFLYGSTSFSYVYLYSMGFWGFLFGVFDANSDSPARL